MAPLKSRRRDRHGPDRLRPLSGGRSGLLNTSTRLDEDRYRPLLKKAAQEGDLEAFQSLSKEASRRMEARILEILDPADVAKRPRSYRGWSIRRKRGRIEEIKHQISGLLAWMEDGSERFADGDLKSLAEESVRSEHARLTDIVAGVEQAVLRGGLPAPRPGKVSVIANIRAVVAKALARARHAYESWQRNLIGSGSTAGLLLLLGLLLLGAIRRRSRGKHVPQITDLEGTSAMDPAEDRESETTPPPTPLEDKAGGCLHAGKGCPTVDMSKKLGVESTCPAGGCADARNPDPSLDHHPVAGTGPKESVKPPPMILKRPAEPIEIGGKVEGLPGFGDPVTLPTGVKVRVAVEVGSTTAKTIVLDQAGDIVHATYQKHHARVYEMSALLLEGVLERFKDQEIVNVGFSGSAGQKVSEKLTGLIDGALEMRYGVEGKKGKTNIRYTNEVISQTAPIIEMYGHLGKDIHIIEIGGEDSKFIHIGSDGRLKGSALNGECAAGTGTFLEEQIPRLGFKDLFHMIEGAWSMVDHLPPVIAGRCTVFAKSDITHLLRHENVSKELVAWGLANTVAFTFLVNLVGEVKRGMAGDGIVIFQGGTAKNKVLVEAFRKLLEKNGLDPDRLVVPEFAEVRIAQGAAMFAAKGLADDRMIEREVLIEGLRELKSSFANRSVTSSLPQLRLRDVAKLEKTWRPYAFKEGETRDVFLGLDVGSTTTKFVLVDAKTDAILYQDYVRTEGQPFDIMEQGIRKIRDTLGEHVDILHVGVTGSGREAMGKMVGADVVFDEINAHATAVGRLHPEVDTIIEIGGQDAKFIRVMKGIVEDFEMNKACAAGTGSFFDEAAGRILNVMVEELGGMALSSMTPADLGEVCTVFMKSRIVLAQAEGYSPEDIAAGLAYSIAKNYLNKVKGSKLVGKKIAFQGGVSNNKAVVGAFEQLTGSEVVVPEHAETMGAIGMALIAKTRYENKLSDALKERGEPEAASLVGEMAGLVASKFRGFDASFVPTEVADGKQCKGCANRCQLMWLKTEDGEKLVYGAGCDIHDRTIPKEQRRKSKNLPDLLKLRYDLLTQSYSTGEGRAPLGERFGAWFRMIWPRGVKAAEATAKSVAGVKIPGGRVIGYPAGLNFWENFPFWSKFFEEAGLEVVVSRNSDKKILDLAKKYINIDPCLPMKMVYGMVADLLKTEGITDVFLPAIIEIKPMDPNSRKSATCPQVQGTPYALKGVFNPEDYGKRFLTPNFDLKKPGKDILKQFLAFGGELGLTKSEVKRAYAAAEEAMDGFRAAQRAEGAKILKELKVKGDKAVVFLGRPYNTLDRGLNMGLDREVRKHGWQALPLDFLPLEDAQRSLSDANNDSWYYQGKILAGADLAADNPEVFPVYITNFRCGPDAFIIKQVEARMRRAGKPLLVLELDEHSSVAGYKTRIDAFIASIGLAQEHARSIGEKAETVDAMAAGGRPLPDKLEFLTMEEMKGKKVFVPRMSDHSILLAGALRAEGIDAEAFSPPTDAALEEGRKHSNGKECLPYPIVAGEAITEIRKRVEAGMDPKDVVVMFMKTNGTCRFSQYSPHLEASIHAAGFDGVKVANLGGRSKVPTAQNHLAPTRKFGINMWKSYLIGDYMHQILLENRPYEIHTAASAMKKQELIREGGETLGDFMERIDLSDPGHVRKVQLTDLIYQKRLREAAEAMADPDKLIAVLDGFVREIKTVPQDRAQTKPLIGVVGEIYLRMNDYANGEIIRQLEAQGAETFLAPMSEFIYNGIEFPPMGKFKWRDLIRYKGIVKLLNHFISRGFLRYFDDDIFRVIGKGLRRPHFSRGQDVRKVIDLGMKHTGGFDAGEGPLTLGAMEEFALHGAAGAVMIGPAGCLPNTISEALIGKMKAGLPPGKRDFPVLAVSMSESRNMKNVLTRTEALVYQAKQFLGDEAETEVGGR
ncbi:acyl-CoA dehydratase activase [Elusimicrobiota bacterium]